MKITKALLLIILGVLAAIAMLFPAAIIMGLFLGIVPGIILTLAPTAFVYYASALALGLALKFFRFPFPTFISLIFLIGLGCLASFLLNKPIVQQVRNFEKLDVALKSKFDLPSTMAIYSKQYEQHGDACNAICQGLLYNRVSQKILVITDPSVVKNNSSPPIVSYEIEQGQNCTNEYVISKRWGKLAGANVESRIAAGECLVKKETKLSEADAIFFHDKISQNNGYQDYTSLKRRVIFVNYIELLKNTGNTFDKIYRYSEISAQPFAYPLSYGPILGAGGGSMSLNFGFFHTSLTSNNPGPSYGNPIQEFKPQMETIFGEALKPIEPAKQDTNQLVRDALNSEAEGNTAGLSMIGNLLSELYLKRKTPTDDDMQLVIEALKDDRTTEWFHLSNFTWLWGEKRGSVPKEFTQELANRILRKKNIEEVARAIRFLPDGDAASIYPQLEQITHDEILRERAYGAIIRLGDAGAKAVPEYINILDEFETAWNESDRNLRTKKLRALGDAPIASVIGLCRLGQEALPAKDTLYQLLEFENIGYKSGLGGSAIDALIEMGLVQELEQKYQSNEEILKEVEEAISNKERAIKKGRRFCGRRIV